MLSRAIAFAFVLFAAMPALRAAFGVTTSTSYYTVDTGAGVVFRVVRSDGGIDSIKLNGTELHGATDSGIASGLGSTGTTTSVWSDANTVVVTVATDDTNGVVAGLTHYYIARNGENHIYMATYAENEPAVGELRWITRLTGSLFPTAPAESDLRGNTGAIESSDVFGMPDGTTRSKYYGNDRAKDLSIRGVSGSGSGVGVFMAYGNRESSSGGPFFRDIQNQTGTNAEVYNYMNSGHNQTEARRLGVLNGPYAVCITDGAIPAVPDMSFIASLGLTGFVSSAGRGSVTVSGISGRDTSYSYTVAFANSSAQYWANADRLTGAATCVNMKPGTYTMTVLKGELAVYSTPVTVAAGETLAVPAITVTADPSRTVPLWRIGNWDGTPLEFRNGTSISRMHPSDMRQANWTPGTFTIGSSALSDFPSCQWLGVNGNQLVNFDLTAAQVVAYTVRIGITAAMSGARPRIEVNSWSSSFPSPSSQPDSRSITIGTYRGNNATFTFNVPASAFVAGTNTLKIAAISGSGGTGYLSPGYALDCVEIYPQSSTALNVPDAPTGLAAVAVVSPRSVVLTWNSVAGAASYEVRRATSAGGPFVVVAASLTATTWTDTDVALPGVYSYEVVAQNTSGVGVPATVSIDPDAPPRSAVALTWTGATSSSWDTTTANWSYSGGATFFYFPDDMVLFDDAAAATSVSAAGPLHPASVGFANSTKNYTLTGTGGGIAGSTVLSKTGTGVLTLSADNSHTGGTTISSGTVTLANDTATAGAFGTGILTLLGGSVQMYDNASTFNSATWNMDVPAGASPTLLPICSDAARLLPNTPASTSAPEIHMPFDPAKPANNAALNSAEMRGRLTSLNSDIQTRATQGDLAAQIGGTSANSNGVANLGIGIAIHRSKARCRRSRISSMS